MSAIVPVTASFRAEYADVPISPIDLPAGACGPFANECSDWLRACAPGRLLLLGDAGDLTLPPGTEVDARADASALAADARYDAVLIRGLPELLDRRTGAALLARARDRLAPECLAVLPRPCWDEGAVLGLGYTLRARAPAALLGHFAIASYKSVPDWFNSKFWAHPERWQP